MKYLPIFILIILISCGGGNNSGTEPEVQEEYTIEELENDPDWIEITDTSHYFQPCFNENIMNDKALLLKFNEFESYLNEDTCTVYEEIKTIDYNKYSLLTFRIIGNLKKYQIRIYYNKKIKLMHAFVFYNIGPEYIYKVNRFIIKVPDKDGIQEYSIQHENL